MNHPAMRSAARNVDTATLLTYGLVGSIVAAYIVARAILVPLSYDEAATFFRYIDGNAGAVFDFSVATNHFLNTIATRLSYHLFGGAPWALRLPNALAGIAFVTGAAALARRAHNRVIGFSGFVLMVTNPYVLDYLALSRGYGLALGLLMGSLYFLLRWMELPPDAADARRWVCRTLWLAGAAVVATFTVLPAFVGVVGVVILRLAWTSKNSRHSEIAPSWRAAMPWSAMAGGLVVAGTFSLLVFAHHPVLSQALFVPITVRAVGLFDDELREIQVWREDASGRRRALDRDRDGVWRTGNVGEAWGLRVELPVRVDQNLTSLDVTVGAAVHRRDRHAPGPWLARDVGSQRVLQGTGPLTAAAPGTGASDRAINWAGERHLWRLAIARAAGLLAAFGALAAGLGVILAAAARAGWVGTADARLIGSAVLAVGAFSAAPLYLLRRDGQLYFGGTAGLVPDTFGSLIGRSAYGVSYSAHQTDIVLVALAVAGSLVIGLMLAWRAGRRVLAAPATIAALIVIVAAQVAIQHAVLGTPWPTGRTALFLLPLLSAFVVLTADALAQGAAPARIVASGSMVLLAVASAWHATSVANVTHTVDWPDDASTPAMIEAVASAAGTQPHPVRIGVDWIYYPVARYYAGRVPSRRTAYAVEVVPGDGPLPEFVYTAQPVDPATTSLVRGFAESSATLWRTRPVP
jgi:hypothetical protein